MTSSRFGIVCAFVMVAGAGCTDTESATNLNTNGPPKIQQVRLREVLTRMDGTLSDPPLPVFAFGTHPTATADEEHPVTSAKATAPNSVRIILDQLLKGNHLEEIACRGQIDEDAYDRVPDGATPDDIAKCAVAKDVLKSSCTGDHTVCICKLPMCGDVPMGQPVGVLDVNQDGAADDTRMIAGAVGLTCGSIDLPIDLQNSYWYPSGNQEPPATGGFDALGPAIVLQVGPAPTCPTCPPSFPTNTTCKLKFADDVTNKGGHKVCTPPEGRPASCTGNLDQCQETCTEGDVSAFSFKVEPLTIQNNSFSDNATGVDPAGPFILIARAPVDLASAMAAITITQGGNPVTGFTVSAASATQIRVNFTTPLQASTAYVLTISTGLKDVYGQPIVSPYVYHFTTAP